MRGKVLLALATLLSLAGTAAARFGMPDPLTDRGRVVEGIYAQVAFAGVLVFVLVFVLLAWVLVRYREGSGKGRATHEKHRGSLAAELTWTLIPLAVVLWVGAISYAGLVTLDRGEEDATPAMTLHVTGVQWAWQVDYGSGVLVNVVATPDHRGNLTYSDTIHVPADVPIALNLTGGDVIHAFNILDGNRAFFYMADANPLGPHKYINQTVTFPPGTYEVQCREMCLNPGHGYMRAQIVAEEQATFDDWLADKALCAGAPLCQLVEATASGGNQLQFAQPLPDVVVAGTRLAVKLHNDGSEPVALSVDRAQQATVAPGETGRVAFDTEGGRSYNVSASPGGSFTLQAVQPDEEITMDLGDFFLRPDRLQLEVGKGYLFRATNIGASTHNLYFGVYGGEVLARSNDAAGGGEAVVFFRPTQAGTIEMWCNVPGHYGMGMRGTVTIA